MGIPRSEREDSIKLKEKTISELETQKEIELEELFMKNEPPYDNTPEPMNSILIGNRRHSFKSGYSEGFKAGNSKASSSNGLYITQNLEPKIEELEEEIKAKDKIIKELEDLLQDARYEAMGDDL